MSLINDALKKAQRQRTGDSPLSQPPVPGGGPAISSSTRANTSRSPQLLLIGVGAVLGLLLATGTILFFRPKPSPATASGGTSSAEKPQSPTNVVAASSAPLSSPPATQTSTAPSQPSPAAPKPAESLPVVKTTSSSAAPAIASEPRTTVDQISPPTIATPPASPPAPSLKMIEAIEALRVAGIRASAGTDAKVLMNDRVYRIGDTVDHALGIKLTAVTTSSLTFSDASGASYTRNF